MPKLNYYLQLLIFSLLVFIVTYFASLKFEIPLYYIVLLSVYFTGFSFILNRQLQSALQAENKNKFTHTFLALTALKMFSCLIVLLFGLYFADKDKMAIGICTMGYYMLYTSYEVWYWLGKLKQAK
jgi:O-antigen/teichoic acid export membrane protein